MTILDDYQRLHPGSAALFEQARTVFPDGVTHDTRHFTPFPIAVERSLGPRKWDIDGNELIDYVSGHGALILGHNRPEVQQAVLDQAARGTHFGASHREELAWGQWVQRLIPSAERVRFTSSGTEAVQMAVRLARAATGRHRLVRFNGHFHGWSDTVAAAPTSADGLAHAGVGITDGAAGGLITLPQNDPAALARAFADYGHEIAATIIEPTGARMGQVPIDPGFLFEIREQTARHGAVMIMDEVVTGFRIAPGGAQAYYGVTPDITTLAKILAGGLPGGAVAGKEELLCQIEMMDGEGPRAKRVSHPGTFNANPLSAAAGAAALAIVATGEPHVAANAAARRLATEMNASLARREIDGCVYGDGSLLHVLLGVPCRRPEDGISWDWQNGPGSDVPSTPGRIAVAFRRAMINHGVDPMSTRLIVSSAHDAAAIDKTLDAFERTLDALRAEQEV